MSSLHQHVSHKTLPLIFSLPIDIRFTDAPTLQHISGTQWTPDIITFDSGKLVKSTSYYVQEVCVLEHMSLTVI